MQIGLWIVFVGLAVLAQVSGSGPVLAAQMTGTGETPEAAIGSAVSSDPTLGRYAGSCETAVYPDDVGALCSDLVETRDSDGMAAYLVSTFDSPGGLLYYIAPSEGGYRVTDVGMNYCEDGSSHTQFPAMAENPR